MVQTAVKDQKSPQKAEKSASLGSKKTEKAPQTTKKEEQPAKKAEETSSKETKEPKSKNEMTVENEVQKNGEYLGRFEEVTQKAREQKQPVHAAVMNKKYKLNKRPKQFREGSVWDTFSALVKELSGNDPEKTMTGDEIFHKIREHDWSHVPRARYTIGGKPCDAWLTSLIKGAPTSKYNILTKVEE